MTLATEDSATNVSLWDRAYDTLANEDRNVIAAYEDLLSRVLMRGRFYPDLDVIPYADIGQYSTDR